jgi:hypothetical protein
VSADGTQSDGRLVIDRSVLSPGDEFTVDILDELDRPTIHGYLAIVEEQSDVAWAPVYVLAAPWGEIERPSWRPWDGHIISKAIGLTGPLRYQLPPEIAPGRYRLREASSRAALVEFQVGPIATYRHIGVRRDRAVRRFGFVCGPTVMSVSTPSEETPAFLRWVTTHAFLWAVGNFIGFTLLGFALAGRTAIWVVLPAFGIALIQWLLYRPGGPAITWNTRLRARDSRRQG